MIGLQHYLILSAVLFSIGLYGALAKRNAIAVMLCIEIMLNAVNIVMAGFSRYVTPVAVTIVFLNVTGLLKLSSLFATAP